MVLTFYNIYFGKDGHIYFNKDNRKEFVKEEDFKKYFFEFDSTDEAKNFKFWTSLLNNNVHFEDGITVEAVWKCLGESSSFWSSLLNIDVKAYLEELEKPKTETVYKGQYDSVLAFNLPTLNLDSYDGANFYHIRMNYGIKGFSNKKGILFNDELTKIPLNEIKDLPFYFERVDGIFLEEDIKAKCANIDGFFTNYYKEAILNDAIYAIFGRCFKSPEHRDNKSMVLPSFEFQRNFYNEAIEKLKSENLLGRSINTLELPKQINSACSTLLPYALKRCK